WVSSAASSGRERGMGAIGSVAKGTGGGSGTAAPVVGAAMPRSSAASRASRRRKCSPRPTDFTSAAMAMIGKVSSNNPSRTKNNSIANPCMCRKSDPAILAMKFSPICDYTLTQAADLIEAIAPTSLQKNVRNLTLIKARAAQYSGLNVRVGRCLEKIEGLRATLIEDERGAVFIPFAFRRPYPIGQASVTAADDADALTQRSPLPMHSSRKELGTKLVKILKDLGLK